MKHHSALIIFAKEPGKDVKTRLIGQLDEYRRIGLYELMLRNTIDALKCIPEADSFIFYAPPAAELYFRQYGMKHYPQRGGDLGEKMFQSFGQIFHLGYTKAALVGVDIPELKSSTVVHAFHLLDEHDVVFGPAMDGGYYLIGLKEPFRDLFSGIEWSTETTLAQSVQKAARKGMRIGYTERFSDVDIMDDVMKTGIMTDPRQ